MIKLGREPVGRHRWGELTQVLELWCGSTVVKSQLRAATVVIKYAIDDSKQLIYSPVRPHIWWSGFPCEVVRSDVG